jgi:ATP-binding cassette subfamily C protein LapB
LAEALVVVAHRHGLHVSETDIKRRLPYDPRGLTLPLVGEVASGLRLQSRIVEIKLDEIPPITLPVILLDDKGQAIVLSVLSRNRKRATVIIPTAGDKAKEVAVKELGNSYSGIAIFLTPVSAASMSEEAPQKVPRHWFWSVFATFRPEYSQVVLAAFLINTLGLALPIFIRNVYDRVIPNLAIPTLWALAAGVVLALLVELLLRILRSNLVDGTGRRVDLVVASRLFDRLLAGRLESKPASAGVIASQLRDFDSVRDVLTSSTLIAVTDLLFIGIFLLVLWALTGPLVIVPLIAVVAVLILATAIQVPLSRSIQRSQSDTAQRHGVLVETAGSIEALKAIGAEPNVRRRWRENVAATSRSTTNARFWANLSAHAVVFANQAVMIAIVVWGVFLVIDGTISVGALIAASLLAGRVLAPLGNIVQTLARAQHALGAVRTLDRLMNAPIEAATSGDGRMANHGDIVFRNVSFTYPDAETKALSEVSLTIRKGERVGLIGRIGSGKTSLGRIIAGLYEPTNGQVLVDGMDIRQFGADIRTLVGFSQQDVELFSGTLSQNLTMGMPDASAKEIERAVRLSGVDTFASRHPKGLNMPVAERGRSLSGGQRQSIGLARVLIRNPKILFLDEPTAALDTASERALVQRLKSGLDKEVTVIVSTHRDGMLELVDRLVVFDNGRVVTDGPKAEVISRLRDAARSSSLPPASLPKGEAK